MLDQYFAILPFLSEFISERRKSESNNCGLLMCIIMLKKRKTTKC